MPEIVYHTPALLAESIDGLDVRPDGTYVDVTFGGGGHSREIVRRLGRGGRLFSFDQDADARKNAIDDERFTFVLGNFRFLQNFLHYHGVETVDGILADLGVSFHHFDDAERGFSFRFDAPLDMRMNRAATLSAADVVNTYDEKRLADLFFLYGELNNARSLAHAIVVARTKEPITTTAQLQALARPKFGKEQEKKYLAKMFQALRIEVNNEMDALRRMLAQAEKMLAPGGRLSVITYHSLEDRIVKNFMKSGNFEGRIEKDFYGNVISPWELVNSKVIVPSDEEVARNPRSRSAKLRIAKKKPV